MSLRSLLFRRPQSPRMIAVCIDGKAQSVCVRRHARARRYTLRIQAVSREVVLTMPMRGSLREAKKFAQRHAAWIAARISRLGHSMPFVDGATVPLRGEAHRIAHRSGARGTAWPEADANGARLLCVAGGAAHVERRVRDFLKREARRDLDAASRAYAAKFDVRIARISLRDQSSRWGSCSTGGVLSYSWRLILAPPYVLDYLAAHEVAHLVELNHSPRFWRLVLGACPDTHRAKTWLDMHGAQLHCYGRRSA